MHRLVVFVVAGAVCLGSAGIIASTWNVASSDRAAQEQAAARPWQVGTCYRVFPRASEPPELFKVISPPEGSWVRVDADPRAPWVPGARPRAAVWVNINSVFVAQEWPCSIFP